MCFFYLRREWGRGRVSVGQRSVNVCNICHTGGRACWRFSERKARAQITFICLRTASRFIYYRFKIKFLDGWTGWTLVLKLWYFTTQCQASESCSWMLAADYYFKICLILTQVVLVSRPHRSGVMHLKFCSVRPSIISIMHEEPPPPSACCPIPHQPPRGVCSYLSIPHHPNSNPYGQFCRHVQAMNSYTRECAQKCAWTLRA